MATYWRGTVLISMYFEVHQDSLILQVTIFISFVQITTSREQMAPIPNKKNNMVLHMTRVQSMCNTGFDCKCGAGNQSVNRDVHDIVIKTYRYVPSGNIRVLYILLNATTVRSF